MSEQATRDDAALAAAAIGIALPTALPGYFYLVAMMEGHGWARAWIETVVIELLLAVSGALVGVLAVRALAGRSPKMLPLVPLALMGAVGVGAAIYAGSRNAGYGEAGILVLLIWVLGSPIGGALQLGTGSLVWALARPTTDPRRRLWALGTIVVLHVLLKSWSTPLVFGTLAAVLGVVLAGRAKRPRAMLLFGALACASIAIEVARMASFASTVAAGLAIVPF